MKNDLSDYYNELDFVNNKLKMLSKNHSNTVAYKRFLVIKENLFIKIRELKIKQLLNE